MPSRRLINKPLTPFHPSEKHALASFDNETGRLRLSLSYFDHHRRPSELRQLFSSKLVDLLGPPRDPDEPVTERHSDIAHAVQRLTEDLVLRYIGFAQRLVPSRHLCIAGGVALNGVANAATIESGRFDSVFIQPAANDAGTSIGGALLAAAQATTRPARQRLTNVFLGPEYGDREIEVALLTANQAGYRISTVPDPCAKAASLLARGLVIGWFQGRMEFGPRALGGRSILANPTHAATRDRVNAMIKRREMFRPLAPAVLEEHAADYFHLHDAGRLVYPYMLTTAKVVAGRRSAIPAVVHVDGSARIQTVSRTYNPLLWRVIECFRHTTGIPVVLNTSFNGADEPIVCSPQDAVRTLLSCGLDALLIGDYLAIRSDLTGRS